MIACNIQEVTTSLLERANEFLNSLNYKTKIVGKYLVHQADENVYLTVRETNLLDSLSKKFEGINFLGYANNDNKSIYISLSNDTLIRLDKVTGGNLYEYFHHISNKILTSSPSKELTIGSQLIYNNKPAIVISIEDDGYIEVVSDNRQNEFFKINKIEKEETIIKNGKKLKRKFFVYELFSYDNESQRLLPRGIIAKHTGQYLIIDDTYLVTEDSVLNLKERRWLDNLLEINHLRKVNAIRIKAWEQGNFLPQPQNKISRTEISYRNIVVDNEEDLIKAIRKFEKRTLGKEPFYNDKAFVSAISHNMPFVYRGVVLTKSVHFLFDKLLRNASVSDGQVVKVSGKYGVAKRVSEYKNTKIVVTFLDNTTREFTEDALDNGLLLTPYFVAPLYKNGDFIYNFKPYTEILTDKSFDISKFSPVYLYELETYRMPNVTVSKDFDTSYIIDDIIERLKNIDVDSLSNTDDLFSQEIIENFFLKSTENKSYKSYNPETKTLVFTYGVEKILTPDEIYKVANKSMYALNNLFNLIIPGIGKVFYLKYVNKDFVEVKAKLSSTQLQKINQRKNLVKEDLKKAVNKLMKNPDEINRVTEKVKKIELPDGKTVKINRQLSLFIDENDNTLKYEEAVKNPKYKTIILNEVGLYIKTDTNVAKAKEAVHKILPNIPINIIEDYITLDMIENKATIGKFEEGVISLSVYGKDLTKTAKHEALHAVLSEIKLTKPEYFENIMNAAAIEYGIRRSEKNDEEIEERLAESYESENITYSSNLLKTLWQWIKDYANFLLNQDVVDKLKKDISRGKYRYIQFKTNISDKQLDSIKPTPKNIEVINTTVQNENNNLVGPLIYDEDFDNVKSVTTENKKDDLVLTTENEQIDFIQNIQQEMPSNIFSLENVSINNIEVGQHIEYNNKPYIIIDIYESSLTLLSPDYTSTLFINVSQPFKFLNKKSNVLISTINNSITDEIHTYNYNKIAKSIVATKVENINLTNNQKIMDNLVSLLKEKDIINENNCKL